MADELDETSVTVFATHGKFLVWNADDAFKLRSRYRVVGSLIGSFPRKPKQNQCFSLPFLLTRNETMLLNEKGLCTVVETPVHFVLPSKEEVESFNQQRGESVLKQRELFQKAREEKQKELAEVIKEGRRKKEKQGRQKKRKRNENGDEETFGKVAKIEEGKLDGITWYNDDPEKDFTEEENTASQVRFRSGLEEKDREISASKNIEEYEVTDEKIYENHKLENRHCPQQLTDNLSWKNTEDVVSGEQNYNTEQGTLIHIPTVMPKRPQSWTPVKWALLETEKEKLQYKVFSDLWERGYFITSGSKFGGDFLAYPGDPSRFHSFYIIIIIPWGKKITPFEMITAGRLSVTVKKTAVLCSVGDDNKIVYTSVKWSALS